MNSIALSLERFLLDRKKQNNDWPAMTLEKHDNEAVYLHVNIDMHLPCLKGHFPEQPVLPGIVQVHWAATLAKQLLDVPGKFQGMSNVKFQTMILPTQSVFLKLQHQKDRVMFHYYAEQDNFSQGKLSFS